MRGIIHLPIIHDISDLGKLGQGISGREQARHSQAAAEQFWGVLEATLDSFGLDYRKVKIYQDGLPVCGKEFEIVTETADSGSRNFRLLRDLRDKGATVMGTESPELLLEEYALMQKTLNPQAGPPPSAQAALALLDRRDEYIAKRIADTLQDEEIGLLFIGLLHNVEEKLPKDIAIIQPFGKPKLG